MDGMAIQSFLTIEPTAAEAHTAALATPAQSVAYSMDSRVHAGPGLDSQMPANHASIYAILLVRLDQDAADQRPRRALSLRRESRVPRVLRTALERDGCQTRLGYPCQPPSTAAYSTILQVRRRNSSLFRCDATADGQRGHVLPRRHGSPRAKGTRPPPGWPFRATPPPPSDASFGPHNTRAPAHSHAKKTPQTDCPVALYLSFLSLLPAQMHIVVQGRSHEPCTLRPQCIVQTRASHTQVSIVTASRLAHPIPSKPIPHPNSFWMGAFGRSGRPPVSHPNALWMGFWA